MSAEVPGLSHPSVPKALAAGEPLPLPCSPRAAGAGHAAGTSVPLHPGTSLSLGPGGGDGCARAYRGDSHLAPAARPAVPRRSPPCRHSAPDAHRPAGPGGEARRSSLLPSILRLSRLRYLQGG